MVFQGFTVNRTAFGVRAFEVAGTHQKFADDFAADEFEMFFKEFNPFVFASRMVRVEPVLERAVFLLQRLDLPCIENDGIDFQAVADNTRIGKQAFAVGVVEGGNGIDVEPLNAV